MKHNLVRTGTWTIRKERPRKIGSCQDLMKNNENNMGIQKKKKRSVERNSGDENYYKEK